MSLFSGPAVCPFRMTLRSSGACHAQRARILFPISSTTPLDEKSDIMPELHRFGIC